MECPPGFKLDKLKGFCIPEDSFSQAKKKTVKPTAFNNFSMIINGVAKDLGNTRPKKMKPAKGGFAIIVESKSGGNRARGLSASNPAAARLVAKNIALRNSDARVVILARRVGTLDGKAVFKDIVGFKPSGNTKATSQEEIAAPFKMTPKMERCIQAVKINLRKNKKGMDTQTIKSAAIAICRARLKK